MSMKGLDNHKDQGQHWANQIISENKQRTNMVKRNISVFILCVPAAESI